MPKKSRKLRVGFIDHYLDNWHANQYPRWLENNDAGVSVELHSAYAQIDRPGGVANQAWCDERQVPLRSSIEEVIAESDALIVLSPDNPEEHINLASLPLRSGKPVYVDKTFTPDGESARQLVTLARESGTPFFSASALRFCQEFREVPFLGKAEFARTHGSGNWKHYTVHQLEMISALMGRGVQRIRASLPMGTLQLDLDYGDGRRASLSVGPRLPFGFYAVPAKGDPVWQPSTDSNQFFRNLIAAITTFFKNPEPPVHPADTVEIMEVIGRIPEALEHDSEWI